jgi:hypothetical protein
MSIGKLLVIAGFVMAAAGVVIWLVGRTGFTGLPGDIRYSKGNFALYFPLASCIALSVILTVILSLIARLRR